jgi:hypothetical protein
MRSLVNRNGHFLSPSDRRHPDSGKTEAAASTRKLPRPLSARAEAFGRSRAGPGHQPLRPFPIGTQSRGPSNQKETTMTTPAHKLRISNLSAVIWRNSGTSGSWYSVQLKRSYKSDDEQWRDTDNLGTDDLLTAAKLLDLAHTWILQQLEADRKSRKDAQAE